MRTLTVSEPTIRKTTISLLSKAIVALSSVLIVYQSAHAKSNGITGEDGLYSCSTPHKGLFKKENPNDYLQIDLIMERSSFTDPNKRQKEDISDFAVIRVNNPKEPQKSEILPVGVTMRGKSRASSCTYKPLRFHFINEDYITKINEMVTIKDRSSVEYLKAYYNALTILSPSIKWEGKSLDKGIFRKLGDDIKFVTHCGPTQEWEMVGAKTPKQQAQRLLGEYYVYQIYNSTHLLVEEARLTRVNYINPDGTQMFDTSDGFEEVGFGRWGILREPSKSAGKRCKLENKPPEGIEPFENMDAALQTHYFNNIINNQDFGYFSHNINILYSENGAMFTTAYDFDLSGIFIDGFNTDFRKWLEGTLEGISDHKLEIFRSVTNRFLLKSTEISEMVESALMDKHMKDQFRNWLNNTSKLLTEKLQIQPGGVQVKMLEPSEEQDEE